jgi:hypothetical protein
MAKPTSDIEARQTEAERRAAPPPAILVDVYGSNPPKAAEAFGGNGVSDRAGCQEAADMRRQVAPGQYDSAKR